jgi:hypothetical protein
VWKAKRKRTLLFEKTARGCGSISSTAQPPNPSEPSILTTCQSVFK